MIHVITAANRHLYERELLEHYRIRHDIYVDERGWKLLEKPDKLERDQFDTDDAIYLLYIEQGRVIAGSRLVPTIKPNLMNDVFPHLASVRGVPCDPGIFDWTRIFVVRDRREGGNAGKAAGTVLCGMLEYCLDEGIHALSVISVAWWLPRLQEMGWEPQPLGLPECIDSEWALALLIPISEETLAATRAFHGIERSVLVRRGLQRAAIEKVYA